MESGFLDTTRSYSEPVSVSPPPFPAHQFWTSYVSTIATVQVEVSTQVPQLETFITPSSSWAIQNDG